ncbi:galactose oxidase [Niabella pedocola]|uniref:Galactose oxidase n=1 Tax=Niabella pedocola TaxID=1752077 RepID=A0ABS8PP61_9BACT|nr:galactose oxidase [Niabella pedocola]MCD2422539.1 galactose oxidase [Niabella pedocola]
MLAIIHTTAAGQAPHKITTGVAPAIPDPEGFAGMFAGVSHQTLVAAGGANFPGKKPWEGGAKVWYADIFLLKKGAASWEKSPVSLPRPLGYGVSASYKDKVILAGGSNQQHHHREVYTLSVQNNKVVVDSLAPMPYALANMAGTIVGDVLFIAGGSLTPEGNPVKRFLALDLKHNKWIVLEPWPGAERMNAVAAAADQCFFLFSGIQVLDTKEGKQRKVLEDGYCFIPQYRNGLFMGGHWKVLPPMPRGVAAAPGPAPVFGKRYIVIPGGLDHQTAQHADPLTHPGFLPDLLAYDTRQERWMVFDRLPRADMRLTAPAVVWDHRCFIINGERLPGLRSNTVWSFNLD